MPLDSAEENVSSKPSNLFLICTAQQKHWPPCSYFKGHCSTCCHGWIITALKSWWVLERARTPADLCFWRHAATHSVLTSLASPLQSQVLTGGPEGAWICQSARIQEAVTNDEKSLGPCWPVQAQALLWTSISKAWPKPSVCQHMPTLALSVFMQ